MKNLVIQLPKRDLKGHIVETWDDVHFDAITHILAVFNAKMPIDWSKESIHAWQNIQILKILNKWTDEDLTEWRHASMTQYMFEFPDLDINDILAIWYVDLDNLIQQSLEFALTVNTVGQRCLKQTFYKNPLPWIKLKDKSNTIVKWYSGFSDENEPFRDYTLSELGRVFTLYETYREESDNEAFLEILAIMFRPGKSRADRQHEDSDDPRQPLEQSSKKLRIRKAMLREQLPSAVLSTLELHLTSAMMRFSELYPTAFSSKGDSKKKGDFLDFILELADYDPAKSDDIAQRSAHDMFELAERLIQRAKNSTPQEA